MLNKPQLMCPRVRWNDPSEPNRTLLGTRDSRFRVENENANSGLSFRGGQVNLGFSQPFKLDAHDRVDIERRILSARAGATVRVLRNLKFGFSARETRVGYIPTWRWFPSITCGLVAFS